MTGSGKTRDPAFKGFTSYAPPICRSTVQKWKTKQWLWTTAEGSTEREDCDRVSNCYCHSGGWKGQTVYQRMSLIVCVGPHS